MKLENPESSKPPQEAVQTQANRLQSVGDLQASHEYVNLHEAARKMGCTTRWMRRHWPELVRDGVVCFRVPKGSVKGRLVFEAASLEAYLRVCQIEPGASEF